MDVATIASMIAPFGLFIGIGLVWLIWEIIIFMKHKF